MLTLSVVASLMALPVAAIDYSDVVAPLYIGLEDVTADLAISSNGYASCEGSASVRDNYTVTVVVELQQKNGTWKTIKTWTEQGGVDAFVKGSYWTRKNRSLIFMRKLAPCSRQRILKYWSPLTKELPLTLGKCSTGWRILSKVA